MCLTSTLVEGDWPSSVIFLICLILSPLSPRRDLCGLLPARGRGPGPGGNYPVRPAQDDQHPVSGHLRRKVMPLWRLGRCAGGRRAREGIAGRATEAALFGAEHFLRLLWVNGCLCSSGVPGGWGRGGGGQWMIGGGEESPSRDIQSHGGNIADWIQVFERGILKLHGNNAGFHLLLWSSPSWAVAYWCLFINIYSQFKQLYLYGVEVNGGF